MVFRARRCAELAAAEFAYGASGAPGSLVGITSHDDRRTNVPLRHPPRARAGRSMDPVLSEVDCVGAAAAVGAMAAFFVGWVAIGLVLAHVLIRRGHDVRTMTALGIGLGPILVALVIEPESDRRPLLVRAGVDDDRGHLDVLIVLAGGPAELEELQPTLRALHGIARRLTIATAVPFESHDPDSVDATLREATDRLTEAASRVTPVQPRLVVLAGRSAPAADRFARAEGIDLTLHTGTSIPPVRRSRATDPRSATTVRPQRRRRGRARRST